MEQGPDFWCWFDTTQFSYHCVHPIHAKMFSIQMLLHFSQIVQRVCTLVLFINFLFIIFPIVLYCTILLFVYYYKIYIHVYIIYISLLVQLQSLTQPVIAKHAETDFSPSLHRDGAVA